MKVKIGTAPVSWGIWFPEDDKQMSWERCMNEMSQAGYQGVELGPWGYFPNVQDRLKDELQKRNLELVATTLMDDLTSVTQTNQMIKMLDKMAELQLGFDNAKYVVLIDAVYTDLVTGELLRSPVLSDDEMKHFINNIERIRDHARDRYGLEVIFHPHAQTHIETEEQIEKLLEATDLNFCFDIGHHAYAGGEPVSFMKKHYKRIPYLHIKNCDKEVREVAIKENWSFAKAVGEGIMVEPESGLINIEEFAVLLNEINFDGWAIVEQDMYPAPFDKPYPVGKRTREYLTKVGIG